MKFDKTVDEVFGNLIEKAKAKLKNATQHVLPPLGNPNILKTILGMKLGKHNQVQYLIEKFSGDRAWKDEEYLVQKNYEPEILLNNKALGLQIFSSLYRNTCPQQIKYNRQYTIFRGGVLAEGVSYYKGGKTKGCHSQIDSKVIHLLKRQNNQQPALEYHSLKINPILYQTVFLERVQKGDNAETSECIYWYRGTLSRMSM